MASNKKKSIVSRSPDESLSLNKNGEPLTRGETRVLGQNGPFLKLNVQNGHILKLLFKMASLMPRRRYIIKKYFFFVIIVKVAVGKRGFIFVLKPQLGNAASFLY